ncbi:MAG: hypothetical protein U0941_10695 [Planctomycetaceae bacterium]
MDPDNFQQAWQADKAQIHVKIDTDHLHDEVQSAQRGFLNMIFWRDFREVAVGIIMLPTFVLLGRSTFQPWAWYLTIPSTVFVIGFILIDRMRHPQSPCEPSEPLLQSLQVALAQVEHQIWLLRNVFWWYLLPFSIAIMAYFIQVSWKKSDNFLAGILVLTFPSAFLLALYRGVYLLNQLAVRKQLEPRRGELMDLLARLHDTTTDVDRADATIDPRNTATEPPNHGRFNHVLRIFFRQTDRAIRFFIYGSIRLFCLTVLWKMPEQRQKELFSSFTNFVDELMPVESPREMPES